MEKELMTEQKKEQTEQKQLLFIGTPGSGITSILNAYAGNVIFNTDISFDGTGITKKIETFDDHGILLMNTPGISAKTIKIIEKGLNYPGKFIINIVITINAGRLSPDDMVIINSILSSISSKHRNGNFTYGFIINNIGKFAYKSDMTNIIYVLKNIFDIPPSYVLRIPEDFNVNEQPNTLLSPDICNMIKTTIDKCEYVSIVTSPIAFKKDDTLVYEKIRKVLSNFALATNGY